MKKAFVFFIVMCGLVMANHSIANNPNKVKLQKARNLFLKDDYEGALSLYKEEYENNKENALLNFRMAECYYAIKNYDVALSHLEKSLKINQNVHKDIYLVFGKTLFYKGEIDKALSSFEKYKENKLNKAQKKEVNVFVEQSYLAKKMINNPVNVKIINLGGNINSSFDDYAPSISADGTIMIFTSRRGDGNNSQNVAPDNKYYENIYIATWNEKEKKWNKAESIKGRLNTEYHDASLSISLDGKHIFIYKNIPEVTKSGDIYVSRLGDEGEWSLPEPLDKTINSTYFESSACLTSDGNTLYFVSERRKGYGNADIYKCSKISQGVWGEAVNLGPIINTPEDEVSVFIHPDGKTLFFSSKGHNSMGGYDIFKSTFVNGEWATPVNLGYPINSVNDDLHFVMTADNKTAYFSALNKESTGVRDIFMIDMTKYDVLEMPKEMTKEGTKEIAITPPAVKMSVLKGSIIDSETKQGIRAEINITDLETNKKIANFTSNRNGEYYITLAGNKKYQLSLIQKGYVDTNEEIDITMDKDNFTLTKDITLIRKEKLPDVVSPEKTPELFKPKQLMFAFQFGSAEFVLTDFSESELDYLIDNMLKNKELKIEVSGHTDNVGSDEYNKKLSKNRANSVVNYIASRGIEKNRIIIQVYGAEKPIATNDTEEGKALNRRVEVKIKQ